MKHYFIHDNKSDVLDLIFAGWGMDEHPFLQEVTENDLCICYDYNDLNINLSIFKNYKQIRLIAWSLGVWAAAKVFENVQLPFIEKIAINGTLQPISATSGIPPVIFMGTLQNLSTATLCKFNRRMCGSKEQKEAFDKIAPQRSIQSLSTELQMLYEGVNHNPIPQFKFDRAIIGTKDQIFPAVNQNNAWISHKNTTIEEVDMAHYPANFVNCLTELK